MFDYGERMMTPLVAIYLYLIGTWALVECDFQDENGDTPDVGMKLIFCFLWPITVPIWILRSRFNGG